VLTLSHLRPKRGSLRRGKKRGRGDKTAGRGTKGQKSRSGGGKSPYFEGGQTPLYRRLPKRGFKNPFKVIYQIVNLKELDEKFQDGEKVTKKILKEKGLIKKINIPVKILGRGDINKRLYLSIDSISASAREKIEKAGGRVEFPS